MDPPEPGSWFDIDEEDLPNINSIDVGKLLLEYRRLVPRTHERKMSDIGAAQDHARWVLDLRMLVDAIKVGREVLSAGLEEDISLQRFATLLFYQLPLPLHSDRKVIDDLDDLDDAEVIRPRASPRKRAKPAANPPEPAATPPARRQRPRKGA